MGLTIYGRVGAGASSPAVRVRHSVNQSVPNASSYVLVFDTEVFDPLGMHSTVTDTGRLTARVSGKYYVSASINWTSFTAGDRDLFLRKNGTTIITQVRQWPPSSLRNTRQTNSTLIDLEVDEYVEALAYQNSGSAKTVLIDGQMPTFSMARVAR